jgi:hypothetical protein
MLVTVLKLLKCGRALRSISRTYPIPSNRDNAEPLNSGLYSLGVVPACKAVVSAGTLTVAVFWLFGF